MPATPKRQGREPLPGSVFLSDVLAGNIRAARSRDRRSQEELAGRMRYLGHDWSRATVSEVERSGRSVSLDEFFALSMALGVTPNELLTAHAATVDLGTARPAPPSLVALWLAGWLRLTLDDASGEVGGLKLEPLEAPQPPSMTQLMADWTGAGTVAG